MGTPVSKMSGEEEFYLFRNISSVGPWDGPQYHIAPVWAFHLQAAFMGFVFFAGTPLNATVLVATLRYKKLRQPLNYILVNVSLGGFLFCIFSVSTVFIASCQGYFIFGRRVCALEAFLGSAAGTAGGGGGGGRGCGARGGTGGRAAWPRVPPKRGVWGSLMLFCILGYKAQTRLLTRCVPNSTPTVSPTCLLVLCWPHPVTHSSCQANPLTRLHHRSGHRLVTGLPGL